MKSSKIRHFSWEMLLYSLFFFHFSSNVTHFTSMQNKRYRLCEGSITVMQHLSFSSYLECLMGCSLFSVLIWSPSMGKKKKSKIVKITFHNVPLLILHAILLSFSLQALFIWWLVIICESKVTVLKLYTIKIIKKQAFLGTVHPHGWIKVSQAFAKNPVIWFSQASFQRNLSWGTQLLEVDSLVTSGPEMHG